MQIYVRLHGVTFHNKATFTTTSATVPNIASIITVFLMILAHEFSILFLFFLLKLLHIFMNFEQEFTQQQSSFSRLSSFKNNVQII